MAIPLANHDLGSLTTNSISSRAAVPAVANGGEADRGLAAGAVIDSSIEGNANSIYGHKVAGGTAVGVDLGLGESSEVDEKKKEHSEKWGKDGKECSCDGDKHGANRGEWKGDGAIGGLSGGKHNQGFVSVATGLGARVGDHNKDVDGKGDFVYELAGKIHAGAVVDGSRGKDWGAAALGGGAKVGAGVKGQESNGDHDHAGAISGGLGTALGGFLADSHRGDDKAFGAGSATSDFDVEGASEDDHGHKYDARVIDGEEDCDSDDSALAL